MNKRLSISTPSIFRLLYAAWTLLFFLKMDEVNAQVKRKISLDEVIKTVQSQSPLAQQVINAYRTRYWSFRTFQSNYLPQLSLETTLPDFNRAIDPILQPDGTTAYLERSVATWSGAVSLNQNITPLGGSVYLLSSLNRFDNFTGKNSNYRSNPLIIGYQQPILQFNGLKWDKKIEPLRFSEAQKQYQEDMEALAVNICNLYFDLLLSQVNEQIAKQNLLSNDTLYKIAQGRYNLGKIAENELLQLELGFMNSRQQVIRSELEVKTATLKLKNALGISTNDAFEAITPAQTPDLIISEEDALAEAKKNRPRTLGFLRQILEAERDVAQAVGQTGFQGNLNASFGLAQSNSELIPAFQSPQDQQRVNFSFSMPLLDWGRRQSRRKTAESNRDLVKSQVGQQEQTFDQDVLLTVNQFEMAHQQLKLSERATEIGQKRFDIARERYLIGKISITDLNIAFQEKDLAKQGYINSLRSAWLNFYELRKATMYDFFNKQIIQHQFPTN